MKYLYIRTRPLCKLSEFCPVEGDLVKYKNCKFSSNLIALSYFSYRKEFAQYLTLIFLIFFSIIAILLLQSEHWRL